MTSLLLIQPTAENAAAFCDGPEAALLARVREGDEDACESLVRRHSGRMLAVARRFLGNDAAAADAVQDAFLSAFQAVGSFAGASTLATWLHRIVVNVCLMRLRSRARRRQVPLDDLLPVSDETSRLSRPFSAWSEEASGRLLRVETRSQVRACIDRLPDAYRTVLLLRDIEECDTDETARRLEVSAGVVKTRLHRARQALRTLLAPLFADEENASRRCN